MIRVYTGWWWWGITSVFIIAAALMTKHIFLNSPLLNTHTPPVAMAAAGGRIRYGSLEGKSMSSFDAIVCVYTAHKKESKEKKGGKGKRREKEKKKDKLMTLCGN